MRMAALSSKVTVVSAVALLGWAWAYQATRPPPPAILGAPGGLPITSPRVQLKDGRHLAYMEAGVLKENARYKVIFVHGFACTKESGFSVSQELVEELGIYMLFFDRAGYGDSDANPKRCLKSEATDVEELADALQLGDKFYVASRSVSGRAGGELLVAAAGQRDATRRSCSARGSSSQRRSRTRSPMARASSAFGRGTRTRSFRWRSSATWRRSCRGCGTTGTPEAGHALADMDGVGDEIITELLLGGAPLED